MEFEFGNKEFPIWIMSDIEPSYLEDELEGPFDYRHPARHIILTSVLNVIQHHLYQSNHSRIDENALYYRTTIPQKSDKPNINDVIWPESQLKEIEDIKEDLTNYKPKVILSFGAFTYEILRRTNNYNTDRSYGSWSPSELGGEFKTSLNDFDINTVNVFPLMDRSIVGWKFLQSHEHFVGKKNADYFHYAGKEIAQILIKYYSDLNIWMA